VRKNPPMRPRVGLLDRVAEGCRGVGIATLPGLGNLAYDCCSSDTTGKTLRMQRSEAGVT
jgi:hypothetical protein